MPRSIACFDAGLLRVPARSLLAIGRLALLMPRQPLAGSIDEEEPGHPDDDDEQGGRIDAPQQEIDRELAAHHRDAQHRHDDACLEQHQQRGAPIAERLRCRAARRRSRITRTTVCSAMPPRMLPTAMSTWWVSAALTTIAISGRFVTIASRIEPAERLAEAEPRVEHVGGHRQPAAGHPDRGAGGDEDDQQERERQVVQEGDVSASSGSRCCCPTQYRPGAQHTRALERHRARPQRAHRLERGQPHEGRLGALVRVHAVRGQAVDAAASGDVGDGETRVVVAQEPGVGGLRRASVAARPGSTRRQRPRPGCTAVASIGCWSNWRRVPPCVHQPSLPMGVKVPRRDVWTRSANRGRAGRRCAGARRDSRRPADDQGVRAGRVLVGQASAPATASRRRGPGTRRPCAAGRRGARRRRSVSPAHAAAAARRRSRGAPTTPPAGEVRRAARRQGRLEQGLCASRRRPASGVSRPALPRASNARPWLSCEPSSSSHVAIRAAEVAERSASHGRRRRRGIPRPPSRAADRVPAERACLEQVHRQCPGDIVGTQCPDRLRRAMTPLACCQMPSGPVSSLEVPGAAAGRAVGQALTTAVSHRRGRPISAAPGRDAGEHAGGMRCRSPARASPGCGRRPGGRISARSSLLEHPVDRPSASASGSSAGTRRPRPSARRSRA